MAKPTSTGSRRSKLWLAVVLAVVAVGIVAALAGGAFASGVSTSVVDAIAPTGSVTLAPGGSGSITINLSVTGSQVGTATFEVDRDWTLSGGTFTGSNPQQFTVSPRAATDPATTFQTTGTVTVDSGQADGGPFTVQVGAFDITNTNSTGAKLSAGTASSYSVTVSTPAPSDTTAPIVNVSTDHSVPTSGYFTSSPQQVDTAAYDPSGVTNIQCSVDGGAYMDASSQTGTGASSSLPRTGTVSVSGDGSHVVVCRATDGASPANTGAATGSTDTVTVNIDSTAPSVNCTAPDQTAWYGANQSVICTASDSGSGLANSADASFTLSTSVAAGDETDSASTPSETVYDVAGNSTAVGPYTYKIDRKAPVISDNGTTETPTGNDGTNDWYNHDVTVDFSATDGGSGLATSCPSSWTETTSGEGNNVTASSGPCADQVGNTNPGITSSGYHIDEKAPTVNCTAPDQTAWYGANQSVTCTASDSGSGLADSADASFTLSTSVAAGDETDSASTPSKTVYDVAGNSTTVGPYTYKIDRQAPQLTSCDTPDADWQADNVTLNCTYTDDGSGPASQQVPLTTNVSAGTETANAAASASGAQACDNVGNCANSPADISGNKIDRKAPVISDNGTSDAPTGFDGIYWYNHDVTVNFSATDGGSGLATSCPSSWTETTSGEGNNVTASSGPCADNVGNTNPGITSTGYNVDKTPPAVTCGTAPTFLLNQANAEVSASVTDSLSGPASPTESSTADTSAPGTHTVLVSGLDNAGNLGTAYCPYTVNYGLGTGFLPPLNPDDTGTVLNVGNSGKTYPIKWQLTDANGNYVANAVNGTTISTVKVACTTFSTDTGDAIDTTATGGTSLRYDSTANQYVYNWQTPTTKSTCYRLTINLPGGQKMIAAFQMK
jgi:hypothetical protein